MSTSTNSVKLTSAKNPQLTSSCAIPPCVKKKVVVIIDPGHGYASGLTGSTARMYTYKINDGNGKPVLDSSGNPKLDTKNVIDLPEYARNDSKKWIVSVKEDHSRPERALVFAVATKMKAYTEKSNLVKNVFLTRGKGPIKGSDDAVSRKKRIDLANNKKADYFISIHADGVNNFHVSRSHVIFLDGDQESLELAKDITNSYSIVPTIPPKKDTRNLQVLKISNKTKRKVLVELGFITSPMDSYAMHTNMNKIAEQLHLGLIENIKKNFK